MDNGGEREYGRWIEVPRWDAKLVPERVETDVTYLSFSVLTLPPCFVSNGI